MTELRHIILNNRIVSPEEISLRSAEIQKEPDVSEWEKELYQFLNEWFSDSEFIRAQTSGSTGEPKTIELSKSMMRKSAGRTIGYLGLQKNDCLLLSLPCRYIAGKMMVVRAIVGQMNLIPIDPSGDFEILNQQPFQLGAMVPNQVFKILEQPSGKEKLGNIRNLLIGGSAISTELEKKIATVESRIVSTYGMTETASHVAIRELSGKFRSDVYHCLTGITVSTNPESCLQIHHPEFKEPLQTNDLAEVLSSEEFRILGRADSVIISGGIKYSPETLERKLEGILSQRFVISSVPDEKLGEKMVLVIEGNALEKIEIRRKMNSLFSSYERPKDIFSLEKFPETISGKIIRDEIKKLIK